MPRQQVADAGIRSSLSKPVRHVELHDALLGVLAAAGRSYRPAAAPRPDPALGIRVLVVEDNPVNQLVATGLLENLGCSVDIADDGVEAVERLTGAHEYAVVLMDCRMPRLDGFDATRQVRAQEPPRPAGADHRDDRVRAGGRAGALPGAGMDDYLTKPVDAAELERALRTWARPAGRRGRRAARTPRAAARGGGRDRRPRPRPGADARGPGQGRTSASSSAPPPSFMGRVGDQLVAIREAVDAAQRQRRCSTSAHQLKGSALNLGLPRVAAAAARLEALGTAGRTDGAERAARRPDRRGRRRRLRAPAGDGQGRLTLCETSQVPALPRFRGGRAPTGRPGRARARRSTRWSRRTPPSPGPGRRSSWRPARDRLVARYDGDAVWLEVTTGGRTTRHRSRRIARPGRPGRARSGWP